MRKFSKGLAIVAVLVSLAAAPSQARAENSAKWFVEQISEDSEIALLVLDSVALGLAWANADLGARDLPPLYCVPDLLALTAEQYADILRRYVEGEGAPFAEEPAGLVLLNALKTTFPCL